MSSQPFRFLRYVLWTLLVPLLVSGSAQSLLTIGDSMTSGFPHDAVSYQSKINDVLDPDPTYIGGQLADPIVPGSSPTVGTLPIVGGDGYFVSRAPVVDGPVVSAVFNGGGMLEAFNGGAGLGSPDYIVVLAGVNDLIQFISPKDNLTGGLDSFAPSIAGDYTASGTFTDNNGVDPAVDHPVDSLISRYEDLLDSLAAAYPSVSEIICLPIPAINTSGTFITARLTPAEATLLQTNAAAFNLQVWDSAGPSGLVHSKGDRFSFVDPALLATDVIDGLHPTAGGYEKIGDAVRAFLANGNTAPVLDAIPAKSVDELSELTFTATATDADGGDALTFTLGEGAVAGASITSAGAFSWTPGEEVGPGVYSIPVIVTDDGAGTLNHGQDVEVTVAELNTAPELASVGDQSVDEFVELTFTATATDVDLPAETLEFSLGGTVPAGAEMTTAGVFTWTPTEAQGGGDYTFNVVVTDNGAGALTDTETITVTVNEVNVPPVLLGVPGTPIVNELVEYTFTATAMDDDLPAETLTFSLSGAAPAGADITGGVFTWTPTELQGPGSYTFDVIVTDDGAGTLSASQELTINVLETNADPVIDAISDATIDEGAELMFTATATDSDLPAQTVSFTISGAPVGASITPEGVFTWTPAEGQGGIDYTITVNAIDNGAGSLSDSTDFTVTVTDVNSPPELDAIGDRTVGQRSSLIFFATATDADEPGDTLKFTLENVTPGLISGDPVDPHNPDIHEDTGVFKWTLSDAVAPGIYSFDVVVTDDGVGALSDSETITVTVVEPEIRIMTIGNSMTSGFPHGDVHSYQTFLDENLSIPATYIGDARANPPKRADNGALLVGGDGNIISKVPVVGGGASSAVFPQTGAQEAFEAIKDSVDEPNYVVVMLGTNDLTQLIAPKIVGGFLDVFTPDIPGDFTSAGVFTDNADGESVDHDVDSIIDRYESLLGKIEAQFPSSEIICMPIPPVDSAGSFGGPMSEFNRAKATLETTVPVYNAAIEARVMTLGDQFTFLHHGLAVGDIRSDGLHPTVAGYEKIGIALANFINSGNNAPELGAIGALSVDELDELAFTATVTDDDSGDTHTFKLTGDVPVGASITTAGVFTWTPTEEQGPGAYTFNVMVTDDGVNTLSDGEKITVTVVEVSEAPVLAAIGNPSVIELNELTFTATATDSDLPEETLTFSLGGAVPSGASITPEGVFTWTPSGTDGGNDFTFDVIVTDSSPSAETDSETITVTVFEFNTPPVLTAIGPQSLPVDELTELAFTATATDADVPADVLTFTLDGNVPSGAAITATGDFTWTPSEADGPGSYSFDVIVTDDGGGTLSDSETITINVGEVNVPPVLDPVGDKSVDELVELAFTVTGTDPDVPQQPFSFGLSDEPNGATIDAAGNFTWTPADAQSGEHTFEIIFSDGLATDREMITVTVADINEEPVLDPIGPKTVGELSTLRFIATAQDADDPADTLTFSVDNEPAGVTVNSITGEVRWTLSAAQMVGDYTFDVIVTDDGIGNLDDSETITVTVVEPELHIMTIGDSIAFGLPLDGISYHTYLDENLNIPATYVGNSSSDSGSPMVGGPGSMINKQPAAAVFPNNGVQEIFNTIKSTVTVPDYVVVSVGTNDLIQLISPKDQASPDTFVPDTAGDFTSGGIFTDSDGASSTQHTVPPITARFESLLDDIAAQYPSSTKIISLAMPPVDTTATFGDPQTNLAKDTLATTVPTFNSKLQTLVDGKGSQFVFLDPTLTLAQITDGIHPTLEGYEQVGITIANYINGNAGNNSPVLDPIGDQTVAELATLTFTATATDGDGDDFTFSLSGEPTGASIDPSSGVFTWTPTAAQGPNAYMIEVIVTDDGPGEFQASEVITVTVTGAGGDPYTDWLATHFSAGDLNDPSKEATVWGRQANPDGGEWTNEFEFYLGTDPNVFDEPDFEIVDTPTGAKAIYQKNEDAPLDFVTIEWSIDLLNWDDAGVTLQITGAASGGMEPVEADVTSGSERVFFQFMGLTP